ncbi:hypothetical protein ATSB10_04550 [Dyella thiooxydans]|uniref:Uncharacterized protein n=1 Tax=Dyella thiooxydans TaxID=445710 RepID=A0A161J713_9GAMM|nr:hypothetical protein ATSB10_04550 [Dyella thiooxydans]
MLRGKGVDSLPELPLPWCAWKPLRSGTRLRCRTWQRSG